MDSVQISGGISDSPAKMEDSVGSIVGKEADDDSDGKNGDGSSAVINGELSPAVKVVEIGWVAGPELVLVIEIVSVVEDAKALMVDDVEVEAAVVP